MKNRGFTLLEVMFAALVMVALLIGVLSLYVSCLNLQETAKNSSRASFQLNSKMEEIRGTSFNTLVTYVNNPLSPIPLIGLNGQMRVEVKVPAGYAGGDLLDVRLIAGWLQKGGKMIGEGIMSGGNFVLQDTDADATISSPYEITTAIANIS